MKKHILVISQMFYPEQFRINDICTELVKRGYQVTVLTGIPNYPQGKFYDGYSFSKKRKESWNGMEIIRIPEIPRGNNAIGLMLNYISFVISGFFWKCTNNMDIDLVFSFETSPMTQVLVGTWFSKKKKVPHILYVQDLWPENVEIVTGIKSPIVIKPIEKMVEYIYDRCNCILGTSPSFVKEIGKRCKNPAKVSYWPQYAEEFYQPMEREMALQRVAEIPKDGRFKIAFTGNIGQAQGLEILPKVAKALKEDDNAIAEKLLFVIVGNGRNKEEFLKQIEENEVGEMFLLVGRHPAERIPEFLGCCDAAFISFMEDELFAKTIPAKLQSYMACGKPIIASAIGETKRIIEEADCGCCSVVGDVVELKESILQMMQYSETEIAKMGENARSYFEANFDKKKLMDEFEEYLKSLNKSI